MKITDVTLLFCKPKMGITNIAVLCLSTQPQMTMSKIAQSIGITTAALTGAADQLERLGFVERKQAAGDRRAYHLTATATGLIVVRSLQADLDALAKATSRDNG